MYVGHWCQIPWVLITEIKREIFFKKRKFKMNIRSLNEKMSHPKIILGEMKCYYT